MPITGFDSTIEEPKPIEKKPVTGFNFAKTPITGFNSSNPQAPSPTAETGTQEQKQSLATASPEQQYNEWVKKQKQLDIEEQKQEPVITDTDATLEELKKLYSKSDLNATEISQAIAAQKKSTIGANGKPFKISQIDINRWRASTPDSQPSMRAMTPEEADAFETKKLETDAKEKAQILKDKYAPSPSETQTPVRALARGFYNLGIGETTTDILAKDIAEFGWLQRPLSAISENLKQQQINLRDYMEGRKSAVDFVKGIGEATVEGAKQLVPGWKPQTNWSEIYRTNPDIAAAFDENPALEIAADISGAFADPVIVSGFSKAAQMTKIGKMQKVVNGRTEAEILSDFNKGMKQIQAKQSKIPPTKYRELTDELTRRADGALENLKFLEENKLPTKLPALVKGAELYSKAMPTAADVIGAGLKAGLKFGKDKLKEYHKSQMLKNFKTEQPTMAAKMSADELDAKAEQLYFDKYLKEKENILSHNEPTPLRQEVKNITTESIAKQLQTEAVQVEDLKTIVKDMKKLPEGEQERLLQNIEIKPEFRERGQQFIDWIKSGMDEVQMKEFEQAVNNGEVNINKFRAAFYKEIPTKETIATKEADVFAKEQRYERYKSERKASKQELDTMDAEIKQGYKDLSQIKRREAYLKKYNELKAQRMQELQTKVLPEAEELRVKRQAELNVAEVRLSDAKRELQTLQEEGKTKGKEIEAGRQQTIRNSIAKYDEEIKQLTDKKNQLIETERTQISDAYKFKIQEQKSNLDDQISKLAKEKGALENELSGRLGGEIVKQTRAKGAQIGMLREEIAGLEKEIKGYYDYYKIYPEQEYIPIGLEKPLREKIAQKQKELAELEKKEFQYPQYAETIKKDIITKKAEIYELEGQTKAVEPALKATSREAVKGNKEEIISQYEKEVEYNQNRIAQLREELKKKTEPKIVRQIKYEIEGLELKNIDLQDNLRTAKLNLKKAELSQKKLTKEFIGGVEKKAEAFTKPEVRTAKEEALAKQLEYRELKSQEWKRRIELQKEARRQTQETKQTLDDIKEHQKYIEKGYLPKVHVPANQATSEDVKKVVDNSRKLFDNQLEAEKQIGMGTQAFTEKSGTMEYVPHIWTTEGKNQLLKNKLISDVNVSIDSTLTHNIHKFMKQRGFDKLTIAEANALSERGLLFPDFYGKVFKDDLPSLAAERMMRAQKAMIGQMIGLRVFGEEGRAKGLYEPTSDISIHEFNENNFQKPSPKKEGYSYFSPQNFFKNLDARARETLGKDYNDIWSNIELGNTKNKIMLMPDDVIYQLKKTLEYYETRKPDVIAKQFNWFLRTLNMAEGLLKTAFLVDPFFGPIIRNEAGSINNLFLNGSLNTKSLSPQRLKDTDFFWRYNKDFHFDTPDGKTHFASDIVKETSGESLLYHTSGLGDVASEVKKAGKGNRVYQWLTDNKVINWYFKQWGTRENAWKLNGVITQMQKGKTLQEATNLVEEAMFVYNNAAYTPFENKWMKHGFLFYKWSRNNLPYQLKQMVKRPEQFAKIRYGVKGVEYLISGKTEKEREQAGQVPTHLLSPFYQMSMPVRLGVDATTGQNTMMSTSNHLSSSDPVLLLQLFFGENKGKALDMTLANINPIILDMLQVVGLREPKTQAERYDQVSRFANSVRPIYSITRLMKDIDKLPEGEEKDREQATLFMSRFFAINIYKTTVEQGFQGQNIKYRAEKKDAENKLRFMENKLIKDNLPQNHWQVNIKAQKNEEGVTTNTQLQNRKGELELQNIKTAMHLKAVNEILETELKPDGRYLNISEYQRYQNQLDKIKKDYDPIKQELKMIDDEIKFRKEHKAYDTDEIVNQRDETNMITEKTLMTIADLRNTMDKVEELQSNYEENIAKIQKIKKTAIKITELSKIKELEDLNNLITNKLAEERVKQGRQIEGIKKLLGNININTIIRQHAERKNIPIPRFMPKATETIEKQIYKKE